MNDVSNTNRVIWVGNILNFQIKRPNLENFHSIGCGENFWEKVASSESWPNFYSKGSRKFLLACCAKYLAG